MLDLPPGSRNRTLVPIGSSDTSQLPEYESVPPPDPLASTFAGYFPDAGRPLLPFDVGPGEGVDETGPPDGELEALLTGSPPEASVVVDELDDEEPLMVDSRRALGSTRVSEHPADSPTSKAQAPRQRTTLRRPRPTSTTGR